jgi:aspartyl aminopeptidase
MAETSLDQLLSFLGKSPTPFHVVRELVSLLTDAGFSQLKETDTWGELDPGRYLVCRDQCSLVAFTLTGRSPAQTGFRMAGAHTDSPCLKLKPEPVLQVNNCQLLAVEIYGGPLLNPWFDRDLSLAGRVSWLRDETPCHALIDLKKPIGIIPSLAIHLDRQANTKHSINTQNDLAVLTGTKPYDLKELLGLTAEVGSDTLLAHDLFLYPVEAAHITGIDQNLITGARLDNLISCFCLIDALRSAPEEENSIVLLSTHEEVGSQSAQGARGPFLNQILARLIPDPEKRCQAMARSLMISVDNAHATHPNAQDKHDPDHAVQLNKGIALKWNASQRYATDSRVAAFFKGLCRRSSVKTQDFVMRNDMACGSTIGPITAAMGGMRTLDIGIPSLAMHSAREVCGVSDVADLQAVMKLYFSLSDNDPLWQGHS